MQLLKDDRPLVAVTWQRLRAALLFMAAILLVAGVTVATPAPVHAQGSGSLPGRNYYRGFLPFYQADYRSALRSFTSSSTTAYKFGNRRFLDSVCAWTMMAECHYHSGNYVEALTLYEQALDLYLSYAAIQWQRRLNIPDNYIPNDTPIAQARVTWHAPKRKIRLARVPDSMSMLFGRLDALRVVEQGGVYNPAELRQVDVTEIMRCAALAMHRRRVLRGPTCKHHPLTLALVNGLTGEITNTRTPVGAYNGVLKGIALASQENWDKAIDRLKKSVHFGGGFDHALTPIAYLTLAKAGLELETPNIGGLLALEASFSAAVFGQYDVVNDALCFATQMHLAENRSVFLPLENAIVWARRRSEYLYASLQVRLAECLVEANNGPAAGRVLGEAERAVKRNGMPQTIVASRYRYVAAATRMLAGEIELGQQQLAAALDQKGNHSLSRFQMQLVNTLASEGVIGERDSDLLYGLVLGDPSEQQWQTDPFEAMSALVFSRTDALERWFEIVVSRKDYTRALEVAEQLRRYRFYSRLPLSGRSLALRWLLNGPAVAMNKTMLSQRSDFFIRHPTYQDLVRRSDQAAADLAALPLVPAPKSDDVKKQARLLTAANETATAQEAYLATIGLLREPAEMMFPPQLKAADWLKSLKPGQLALVHVATFAGYHTFHVTDQGVQYLGAMNSRKVKQQVNGLLKSLQVSDSVLEPEDLAELRWQKPARKFRDALWPKLKADSWANVNELLIVPDGWLWYVPFEVLPTADDEPVEGQTAAMLADAVTIRYSPTLFTCFQDQRPPRDPSAVVRTVLTTGKMMARGEIDLVEGQVAALLKQQPGVKRVKRLQVGSGLFASLADQWLVWAGLNVDRKAPLSFVPIPPRIAQEDSPSLNSWIGMPWPGPRQVMMPGFQSDGGNALRGQLVGSDLFLTTCGLMAAGTDEIVVNRWNTGGDTSLRMGREYLKQRDSKTAAEALRGSRDWVRTQEVTETLEPKLRLKRGTEKIKADHPVFWAGPIVVEVPTKKKD